MSEKGSALDFQHLQKAFEDLNESPYTVLDRWLVGAAEPEQLQRDHAMGGAERPKTPGPFVGITTEAVDQHQHRPAANVVVTDSAAEDTGAAQLWEWWQHELRRLPYVRVHDRRPLSMSDVNSASCRTRAQITS